MKLGFVYILKDERGAFYVGSTSNISRRMSQHYSGHTQTTRNMRNPELVLFQEYATLEEARSVERKLKKLKRKDYLEKMVKEGFIKIGA